MRSLFPDYDSFLAIQGFDVRFDRQICRGRITDKDTFYSQYLFTIRWNRQSFCNVSENSLVASIRL